MTWNISTRIYLGFGAVLVLVAVVAAVGTFSLMQASDVFVQYRDLARQTNADGRIQANMLMTRIFAKNFVIEANDENIEGVRDRAQRTLKMIDQSRTLSADSNARTLLVDDMANDLETYVSEFDKVTSWQAERDILVHNKLNILGPQTERALTQIMTSARDDGDTIAAYEAGLTLRSLMLGRLYANRFLIQNDDASVDRAMREFRDLELNLDHLMSQLDDPERLALAEKVKELHSEYLDAFISVRRVIGERNALIKHQLDRIGPEVADRIERLKLSIKAEQDALGPTAQAAIFRAETITLGASIAAIILGLVVATSIGRSVSRPIGDLTVAARAIAEGRYDQDVDIHRTDEIGTLAKAFMAMRTAIDKQLNDLKAEVSEREAAERRLEAAHLELEKANNELEDRIAERTAELERKEEELRLALLNMSDGIYTVDENQRFRMFNDRYVELTGLPHDLVETGGSLEAVLRHEAEAGYFGQSGIEEAVERRLNAIARPGMFEQDMVTPQGKSLNLRKADIPGGGAVVVVSDVTEQRRAEQDLQRAFGNISSSIEYASRIQGAVLPSQANLTKQLGECGVSWHPRDTVGGDAYWCREWGDGVLLILGDCTGHGVPGAFMTLISNGALERAMADVEPGNVAELVGSMHRTIRSALVDDNDQSKADDGLELGACFIEREQN